MAYKRILLYATDTYKLSYLFMRRILLAKPTTLLVYGEKTRQLLLDQSRPTTITSGVNVAAIKLLEWDREWNLVKYHGFEEYAKRWSSSQSWSFSSISNRSTIGGSIKKQPERVQNQGEKAEMNVARVAFMITSNQRHKLSTKLGYNSQDIRSFKPLEALLLLEHDVKKDDDFRRKLKQLMEENGRLTDDTQQQQQHRQPSEHTNEDYLANHDGSNVGGSEKNTPVHQSISPEEAQQIHAKPDVAIALRPIDKHVYGQQDGTIHGGEGKGDNSVFNTQSAGIDETTTETSTETIDKQASAAGDPPQPATLMSPDIINITPHNAAELRMKPDAAAATFPSEPNTKQQLQQQLLLDGQDEEVNDDRPCWYEVVENLPTKPTSNNADHGNENLSPGSDANEDKVIGLFSTRKEALECVRIKQSFRSRSARDADDGEDSSDDRFLIRRRWNV